MSLVLKGKKGIGFSFAWNGLKELIRTEMNFRIQTIIFLIVLLIGILLQLTNMEWVIICLVSGIVLICEVLNTVVEKLVDYIKPEMHPTAKVIKDMSAAAVLIASIVAIVVGLFIFLPKIVELL